jgi:transposase
MDNAKYQRCELVKNLAEKLKIELLFLPSYSPNLNIIERLWKWVKKDCLYCKYYEKFNDFKIAIENSQQFGDNIFLSNFIYALF